MKIKIFIDQGHNPQNPNAGAEGNGLREQDITYDIGVRLAALLNANPSFEAKLSRNAPDEQLGTSNPTSLETRVKMANEWGADFFISLHCNASEITSASGSEAFVYSVMSPAYKLAGSILVGLNEKTGLPNRGVKISKTLYVLRNTKMPALLLELGFITNAYDAEQMSKHPQEFAEGIYSGIVNYFGVSEA